jgi:hypothetical protein
LLRGGPVAIPPYRDAAPIVIAGAPSDLSPEEGQVAWNSAALTVHRKLGGAGVGSWQAVDVKHFPAGGYALMARMACDAMMASEGTGPPFASPHELLTAVDVAVGVVIGRLPHTGVATSMSLTMNRARLVPLATLAIAAGSAITRIGTGVLTPGMQTLHAWTSNAAGTLRTTVDVYVDAAAGAAPSRFTVGGTGVSLYGRESHGLTNGQQIAEAMLVRIDSLATVPFYAARPPQQLDDGLTVLRGAGRCCCFRGRSTGAWRRTGGRCSIRRDCRWCGHRSRRSRG